MMTRNKKIVLLAVVSIGFIVPFIPTLVVIEMFFLLFPFAIIFIGTLIYLIIITIKNKAKINNALFIVSVLPMFILSQIIAGFTVDKIQLLRSGFIISELEKQKFETGKFPESYDLGLGIKYTKLKAEEHYEIKYSRGFMVTEKYNSLNNNWESFGWND